MASQRMLAAAQRPVRICLYKNSSTHVNRNKSLWNEINRLGSEGKWDAINNKPEMFLFGAAKKDSYGVYQKFNKSTNFFDSTPYGPPLYLIWRIGLAFGSVWTGVKIYEFVVPEEKRLHYKYRKQHDEHGHGGGHGHAESHGHH